MLSEIVIAVLVVAPCLYLSYLNGGSYWLKGRCPECRRGWLRRQRMLEEFRGVATLYTTCSSCGCHFRHDGAPQKLGPTPPATNEVDQATSP